MFRTGPVQTDASEAPRREDRAARETAHEAAREAARPGPALDRLGDPRWLAAVLWRRKGPILLCALAGGVLAALASLLVPPRYSSVAQILIDPRDLRVLQNEVSPNAIGGDPTSMTSYLESQARIIASDSIKLRVVAREGLDKDPEFGGEAPATGLQALLPGRAGTDRDGTLRALAALDRTVAVRRGERTFVIDIAVSSRDPAKAARLANAFAEAYLDDQAEVRAEVARRAATALTGRLDELREQLRAAEEKAERYKEAHGMVGAGGRLVSEEQLTLSNAQLVAMRTRVSEAQAKFDQSRRATASGVEAGAIPEAVASNTMTALRAQLGAALAREAELLATVGTRHPSLTASHAQVRDARRQISEELERIRRSAKVELDRALDAERDLARRVETLKRTQVATGLAAVELRELEREIESSRVVYDAFLRRARETGELAGIDTTNARVIGPALPALRRSNTSRRTLALLGAVGGGAIGAAAALALALFGGAAGLRRRPRKTQDAPPEAGEEPPPPAPVANLPVPRNVAAGPESRPEPPETARRPGGWRRLVAIPGGQKREPQAPAGLAAPLLATLPAVRHRRWRKEIEPRSVFQGKTHLVDVLDKPRSGFTAAIGQVRRALAETDGGPPRTILVLPLTARAGASTLALNLALDAALAGEPALLIDAGAGERSLTAVFAPEAELGLADVASGHAGLVRAALQDEGTGLFFLARQDGAENVSVAQIRDGLLRAARRFGPVVIDGATPPGDALSLRFAQEADAILLVIREGDVGSAGLRAALAALGPDAGKLRGFVVNAT